MDDDKSIDALCATHVMGWTAEFYGGWPSWYDGNTSTFDHGDWQPTQDIAQAWLVVERMRALGWNLFVNWGENCHVNFWKEGVSEWNPGESDSAPKAICLAALVSLRALGVALEGEG